MNSEARSGSSVKPKRRDPLLTAEAKGAAARAAGLSEDDCPYEDRRGHRGQITWSRSYRTAWFKGFRGAK